MSKSIYPFNKATTGKETPKIPLILTNPLNGKQLCVLALLDTGADVCTLPVMIARTLELEQSDKTKTKHGTSGISGKPLSTYEHTINIGLLSEDRSHVVRSLNVKVNSLGSGGIPPIIGTSMFLEKFIVTLDYPKKSICLEWDD